jgi:hypothetical protein
VSGELIGTDGSTSERTSKPKFGDGSSGFFDDKLTMRNLEWTLVFKRSPSGQDVPNPNPKLVQLIRIQGLFRSVRIKSFI